MQSLSGIVRKCRMGMAWLALAFAGQAAAQDHYLFMANTASSTTKPNIMIAVDNSANWARSAQMWPDTSGNQGESELLAMKNVLPASAGTSASACGT
jgi:rubrerythrin